MRKILDELTKTLAKDKRFAENGSIKKSTVTDHALRLDKDLLKLLLSNASLKDTFFENIDGTLVFDKKEFQRYVSNKAFLPDSYTAFKNKIGLTAGDQHLSDSKEVVLAWPFKDCVLEGGQTKEEQKRSEIFWNQTLAPDEIDRIKRPKVLTNFKKLSEKGEETPSSISAKDNLLIYGNNLLALHSIVEIFRGKVKLIYIDPPYNTGNDSFQYNDSFNHSAWLTFMKNRLEVAKELLAPGGSIWLNIDDNELAYLMVLMDELFDRSNMLSIVSIKRSAPTGHKAINPAPISVSDFLIGYAKNKPLWNYKITYTNREYDTAYNRYIANYDDGYEKWSFITVKEALSRLKLESVEDLIAKHPERVIRFAEPNYKGVGKETRTLIDKSKKDTEKIFKQVRENHADIYLKRGQRILFYKDKLKEIDGELVTGEPLTNFWSDIPFQGIAKEGNVTLLKGKKPEHLLKRIIEFSTEPGDIVLDFFMGSGSTPAVALKLNRQFIGIEQLDYGNNSAQQRLINCMEGDTSGISKLVGYKGGGSFISVKLKTLNQSYIDSITKATKSEALVKVFQELKETGDLRFEVNLQSFDLKEFQSFPLEKQKEILLECLDLNLLYLNHSEINDTTYDVSEEDKKLNTAFYNLKP